jgi:hypothetical protein
MVAAPMCPAAAALMRPAGAVPVPANRQAAVRPPDPAVALVLQVAVPVGSAVDLAALVVDQADLVALVAAADGADAGFGEA